MNHFINRQSQPAENSRSLGEDQPSEIPLLINERYRVVKPLRPFDASNEISIFEVSDGGTRKILKVLKSSRPKALELFEREALTLQWLKHPGIPDADIDGYFSFTPSNSTQEWHCLVMDFIEGENLEEWVKQHGPISQTLALNWLRQLIEVLELLHENRFFHRDIKPSNIIFKSTEEEKRLVLIDFGSVREITDTYLAKISGGEGVTGIISAGYTPLEQVNGKAVPQSDFYALGRTFIYLLTGKHPVYFPEDDQTGQLMWRESAPEISDSFAALIDDLIAPFPGRRPQTTQIILQRLDDIVLNPPVSVKKRRIPLKLASLLLLGGIGLGCAFPQVAIYLKYPGSGNLSAPVNSNARLNWPNFDKFLNDLGYKNRLAKQFESAEFYLKFALKINPENASAHYNLGVVCEDKGDFDCARTQYQLARQNENDYVAAAAINNLSRLLIWLQGDYQKAADLSRQGLQRAENNTVPAKVKSSLHKNLGWSLLNQEYSEASKDQATLKQAELHLRTAIELNKQNASAHCLLAQVLEAQQHHVSSLDSWQRCLDTSSPYNPEATAWKNTARQRLNSRKQQRIGYEKEGAEVKLKH